MRWIDREHPKVDPVTCPWLIKKFVDSHAEFIFVAANRVATEAREPGATHFDIEGCELGYQGAANSHTFPPRRATPQYQSHALDEGVWKFTEMNFSGRRIKPSLKEA
jgi:hypothetical protein